MSLLVAAPAEGAGGGPCGFFCGCNGRVEIADCALVATLGSLPLAAAGAGVAGEEVAVCKAGRGTGASLESCTSLGAYRESCSGPVVDGLGGAGALRSATSGLDCSAVCLVGAECCSPCRLGGGGA